MPSFADLTHSPLQTDGAQRLMTSDPEGFLRRVWVPHSSKLQFQVDGVLFHAAYKAENNGVTIQIWSILGYLPYSVESAEKRHLLITLLEALRPLKPLIFGIDKENQIVVSQTFTTDAIRFPTYIFTVLIPFLQQALPHIRLIGELLD